MVPTRPIENRLPVIRVWSIKLHTWATTEDSLLDPARTFTDYASAYAPLAIGRRLCRKSNAHFLAPMTFLQFTSDVRLTASRRRIPGNRLFVVLGLGVGIGIIVALASDATKPSYVALLPIGLAMLVPSIWLKNFRIYWLAVFLLLMQFSIAKNLNDGLAVINRLQIDYTIWNFTFSVTAGDLALLILIMIWVN